MPRASIAVVLDFVQSVRPGKGGTRAAEQIGHHAANEFLRLNAAWKRAWKRVGTGSCQERWHPRCGNRATRPTALGAR